MTDQNIATLSRAAHTPGHPYAEMSDQQLLTLRQQMLGDIAAIEKPDLWQRLRRAASKAAAAAAFGGVLLLSEKSFLQPQRQRLTAAEEKDAPHPLQVITRLDAALPEGQERVWSCENCHGCSGGMGGKCFPSAIDKNHPKRSAYHPVTEAQLTSFTQANPQHPLQISEYYRQHPQEPNIHIRGITELAGTQPPPAIPHDLTATAQALQNQTAVAALAASAAGLAAFKAVERVTEKPAHKHAHHLKHEVQHIEDELAARARQANTHATSERAAA